MAVENIRVRCGDISIRELGKRSKIPASSMWRLHRGEIDVSLLEYLIDLSRVVPGGDLPTLLSEILPEDDAALLRARNPRAGLSAQTQAELERALEASHELQTLLRQGDLEAVIRLTQALAPVVDALVRAANAVGTEAISLRGNGGSSNGLPQGEPTGAVASPETMPKAED
jgi:hypothetical protein